MYRLLKKAAIAPRTHPTKLTTDDVKNPYRNELLMLLKA
jgi:hypothetical protein